MRALKTMQTKVFICDPPNPKKSCLLVMEWIHPHDCHMAENASPRDATRHVQSELTLNIIKGEVARVPGWDAVWDNGTGSRNWDLPNPFPLFEE